MGQIRAGSLCQSQGMVKTQRVVKDSTGGQGFNGWLRTQRMAEASTGGQGLNRWPIHFLEIRKMRMMFYGYCNICLLWLDRLDPTMIPAYYQIENVAGQWNSTCLCYFPAHTWPISEKSKFLLSFLARIWPIFAITVSFALSKLCGFSAILDDEVDPQ